MPADIQMQLKRLGIHYERLAPPIETTEIAARAVPRGVVGIRRLILGVSRRC